MICAIHQPNYLPYIGFFDKAARCDIFILYDTTQFRKNGYQNRNRICTPEDWQWITIPVKHSFGQKIKDVEINSSDKALKNNWSKIRTVYGKAPCFSCYKEIFENIYNNKYRLMADLNRDLILAISKILGLKTKFILSSELKQFDSLSTQALIEMCKMVKADTYISGKSGTGYIQKEMFAETGIDIKFQNLNQPVYTQFNSKYFQPYMSIIDLLFNYGEDSIDILNQTLEVPLDTGY